MGVSQQTKTRWYKKGKRGGEVQKAWKLGMGTDKAGGERKRRKKEGSGRKGTLGTYLAEQADGREQAG